MTAVADLSASLPRVDGSIRRIECVVNQFLEGRRNAAAFALGLLHQDVEHIQFWIDAEVSPASAVPLEFADRTRRRRFGVARLHAHRKSITVAEAVARKIVIVP